MIRRLVLFACPLLPCGSGCTDEVLGTFAGTSSAAGGNTSATAGDAGSDTGAADTVDTGSPEGSIPVVAVGENRLRVLSLDMGATWEPAIAEAPDPDKRLRSVIWGEPYFVAVGGDARGRIERSTDGRSWEVIFDDDQGWLGDVTWNGSRYVAVGVGGRVLWSDDAAEWTASSAPITGAGLQSIVNNGALMMAVGFGNVAVSYDSGENWELKADDGRDYNSVTFGGRFVAVDKDGNALVAFEDATPWEEEVALDSILHSVIFTRGSYYASSDDAIHHSTDGVSWTRYETGFPITSLTEGGTAFVAVGWENRFFSDDGLAWESAGWFEGESLHSVAIGLD